ncbi:ParB/RepB/Spo0J family partition protein [Occultella glacieicola]|uniref:ParB/RepB/Spo0J family partition protein n=1 Tax=Occultella glacieicola TaxID=2518684 RepID=A0ABY2DWI8_9MICO|nr:ParB/RepB/Spo0J family partition protein [Occultella glacieicola]TDE88164.1 ParB/RepB/Spo0J family partition protein [Occultella glacieicola]
MTDTGTLTHVAPATLTIETNVRSDADLDKAFVDSIRQHGVLTPIIAIAHEDGTLHVRAGQRRTLAAIEAGLDTIPAYIVPAGDDADRLVEQIVENDQRRTLSDADRTAAWEQLAVLGLSAAQIAKRTGHGRKDVQTGLTVAESAAAKHALATHDLTLAQAAVLAEFEDDTDTLEALTNIAITEPGQFDHTAQRARDDRDAQAAAQAETARLTEAGVTLLTERPAWDSELKDLSGYRPAKSEYGAAIDPADYYDNPDLRAHVRAGWRGEVEVTYYLPTPKKHGLIDRHATSNASTTGPMTEEQKAERRELIANNKAWKSAETVRREWLTTFATRKTSPKDAAQFVANSLVSNNYALDKAATQGHRLARQLLGLAESTGYGDRSLNDTIAKASPARAAHITLVLVLAAIEDNTGVHTWRNATDTDYFAALTRWGYTLSDVEQLTQQPH